MRFGPVPLAEAEGAILAHSVPLPAGRLRKGIVLGVAELARLAEAGVETVTVARLEPGDVPENAAAQELAAALIAGGSGLTATQPVTGRVNLLAEVPGVVLIDAPAIDAVNAVDPMITVATVPPFQQMAPGQMAATVKIIAYAAPADALARAAEAGRGAIRLAPVVCRTAGLVVTDVPGGPGRKGVAAIEGRLAALGMRLSEERIVPHAEAPLAAALGEIAGAVDMLLILTASATSDPDDVGPEALRRAGGQVERVGMPVDPGNLLFFGSLSGRPVIGLPGCARSPALNGTDWVLSRLACGLGLSSADVAAMGVGGLLKEIPTRPQPRTARRPRQ